VASEFEYVTDTLKQEYRSDLNIPKNAKMLLITGGSLGATRLNNEISKIIPELFEQINDLFVVHQVGKGNLKVYGKYENKQLIVAEFIQDLYKYTGAADVIIARSGATTVAELAIQAKPLILIPNPELTGGHQTKNANSLSDKDASIVITENKLKNDPDHLLNVLVELMNDTNMQLKLSENLHNESVQDSANKIAVLLLSLVN